MKPLCLLVGMSVLTMAVLTSSCADFAGAKAAFCTDAPCSQSGDCCGGFSCQSNRCVANAGDPDAGVPSDIDTTITAGPGAVSGANPEFHFTATAPGTFDCKLDPIESVFTPCTSPKTYASLAVIASPGYLFQVRARDENGGFDPTPAEQRFMVASGPTVIITAPANGGTFGPSVTLSFTQESGVTYSCKLDSAAPIANCASGQVFNGLTSAGLHTLTLTGTDSNSVSASQTVTFAVDDTGPGVSISGSPSAGASTNSTLVDLTFAPIPANEPAGFSFECQLDSAPAFTACTSPFRSSGRLEGAHTLKVRAKDKLNNVGGVTTHNWTVTVLTVGNITSIRTLPVEDGTRVRVQGTNVRMTAKTNNRFWMQDADGTSTQSAGMTVRPTNFNSADSLLVPGRILTVIGTVSQVNTNTTLIDATYTALALGSQYQARGSNRDSFGVLTELNEGMLVTTAGRATGSCTELDVGDFCITSCERTTPKIDAIDGVITGSLVFTDDSNFTGIVEGKGAGVYSYYVIEANEQNDACL